MAKYTIQIPTVQFGYIMAEVEGNPEDAISLHEDLLHRYNRQIGGLEDKEWRDCLDRYLTDGDMDSHAYERMSERQKGFIQEIKRSFKRINRE